MSPRRDFLRYRRTGDPEALGRVFDVTAPRLLLVANHMCRGAVRAEDILQATFLDVIRSADKYDESRPLMPWLVGILTNHVRMERRHAAREFDRTRLQASPDVSPDDALGAAEFAQVLERTIAELPEKYRHVLTLNLLHGLTPTQIAHSLGRSPGTIKSWLHRGKEVLRAALPAGFAAAFNIFALPAQSMAAIRVSVLEQTAAIRPIPYAPVANSSTWLFAGGATNLCLAAALVAGGVLAFGGSTELAPGSASAEPPPIQGRDGAGVRIDRRLVTWEEPASEQQIRLDVVRESTGESAAGVTLRVVPEFGADPELCDLVLVSDSRGRIELDGMAAGDYRVHIDRAGSRVVRVPPDGRLEAMVVVPTGHTMRGSVRTKTGEAVEGAGIWLALKGCVDDGHIVTRTDSAGEFYLHDAPAGRLVSVFADGWCAAVARPLELDVPLDFVLDQRAATVKGRVLDASGMPVAGAHLMVGFARSSPFGDRPLAGQHAVRPPWRGLSAADGTFRCEVVFPRWRTRVWARALGTAPIRRTVGVPMPGESVDVVVVVERGAALRGVVRESDGPIDGAVVRVRCLAHLPFGYEDFGPRWLVPTTSVDSSGRFELAGLTPGRSMVRASSGDGIRWSTRQMDLLDGGGHQWEPMLERGAWIRGRVVDSSGTALVGWSVIVTAIASEPERVRTDTDGSFAIGERDEREHTLEIVPPAVAFDRPSLVVREVQPSAYERTFVVEDAELPTARVQGRIADRDGRPWPNCTVQVACPDGFASTTSDASGAFQIAGIPSGTYVTVVERDNVPRILDGPFEVAHGAVVDRGVLLEPPPGRVELEVAGARDFGLNGAWVAVRSVNPQRIVMLATLEDGHASFGLPPGRYGVAISASNCAVLHADVEVCSGDVTRVNWTCEPGVRCDLRIEHPGTTVQTIDYACTSADGATWSGDVRVPPGRPISTSLWLVRGDHEIVFRTRDGLTATCRLDTRAVAGPLRATVKVR